MSKKINLFIAGYKGKEVLLKLINSEIVIDKVFTYNFIENKKYSFEILNLCKKNNIIIKTLKSTDLAKLRKSLFIGNSFFIGWQFKTPIYKNFYVFHDSLLPKFSGFSPTVSALIKGEKKIGISLFEPKADLDKGKIIYQKKLTIKYPIKISEAYDLITSNISKIIFSYYKNNKFFIKKNIKFQKRTFSIWRDDKDYFINWRQSALKIVNFINATGYPYDNAKTIYNGKIINIIDCVIGNKLNFEEIHPGKIFQIIKKQPHVTTLTNLIIIKSAKYLNNKLVVFNKIRKRLG